MDDGNSLPFSAILAGALLTKSSINNIELSNYICMFENDNNEYIDNYGLNKLYGIVGRDENAFYLLKEYNDFYDDKHTVEDYLYSLTNPEIRRFFGIPEKQIENNQYKESKPSIFKMIRTRVFR